jgi:hypothetical protein
VHRLITMIELNEVLRLDIGVAYQREAGRARMVVRLRERLLDEQALFGGVRGAADDVARRTRPPTSDRTPKMLTFESVLALRSSICDIDVGRRDREAKA